MRIGYLIQQFPPEIGAGPARVTEMASRWAAWGAEVTVITAMPNRMLPGRLGARADRAYRGVLAREERWKEIRVLRSWLYTSDRGGVARTVLNNATFMLSSAAHGVARLGPVDVVIASSPPFLPHLAGAVVARAKRCPLVLEIRDLWPDYMVELGIIRSGSRAARALFALERMLLARADHVVVVTDSFRRRIEQKGVAPHKISVVPNGVELDRYHPSDESFPVSSDSVAGKFVVGYLGTFGAGQGLTALVEAAAILQREAPGVAMILAGDGPDGQKVRDHAAKLALSNLAIHPPISRDQTRAFYNGCDACLIPLAPIDVFADTVPSKLFEVMACARPVIASLRGEGERIIRKSGAGVAVEPGNPRAIADGILEMMRHSDQERADMGARARQYVELHYDRAQLAKRYYDLLSGIVSCRGTAPEARARVPS